MSMLGVPWRKRIVPKAVFILDLPVFAVGDQLGVVSLSGPPANLIGISLGIVM